MDLKGKTILITGGNSGLGFEVAKLLVAKESNVIILGRDLKKLNLAKEQLASSKITIQLCDISNAENIDNLAKNIGALDVLINSAGVIMYESLENHTVQKIKEIIDVNLTGTILVTRALLPMLKKSSEAAILNVSSVSGLPTGGHKDQAPYIASKAGVYGFTEALKRDLEGTNIAVFGFYPGGMKTQLFAKAGLDSDTSKYMDPKEVAEVMIDILERPANIRMDHVVVNRKK